MKQPEYVLITLKINTLTASQYKVNAVFTKINIPHTDVYKYRYLKYRYANYGREYARNMFNSRAENPKSVFTKLQIRAQYQLNHSC